MSFLTLNGTAVNVSEGGAKCDWIEVGDRAPQIDGTQESSIRARKRRWSVRTVPMVGSAYSALYTLLTGTPSVTAAGDWLRGINTTVFPTLTEDDVPETVDVETVLSFTLDEG